MDKRQLNSLILTFLGTVFAVAAIILIVWFVLIPVIRGFSFSVSREVIDYHAHHGLDPEIPSFVLEGTRIHGVQPIVIGDAGEHSVYIPLDFLRTHVDPFLFWDRGAGVLFVSTRYEMLEFSPGQRQFYLNGQAVPMDSSIRRGVSIVDGAEIERIYIPQDLLEGLYPLVVDFCEETNIVVLTDVLLPRTVATVSVNQGNVRVRPDTRAPIMAQLGRGYEVVVFLDEDAVAVELLEGFVRVRTSGGKLGYIHSSDLNEFALDNSIITEPRFLHDWINNTICHPPNWPRGQGINMVWDALYNPAGNDILMETQLHSSINVVSPTWFRLDGDNLRIVSVGRREYVDWAHEQGIQVWPKVFDMSNPCARAVLMNRDARRNVINQLVYYADTLGFDGININFEHLLVAEEGPYKIQFLRELAIPMRQRGVVLSAAVKVPEPWSMFYRRDLIGLTMDFVQVMAYDEHWATSPTAGPVASLSWVHRAVSNMLQEVPPEKLIMGLPFYNRIWQEVVAEVDSLRTGAHPMEFTRNFFETRGVVWEWDELVGSYFGEVVVSESARTLIYRVWLEDERSIGAKMHIFVEYDLAGVAGWRRGLETQGVRDVIGAHFP